MDDNQTNAHEYGPGVKLQIRIYYTLMGVLVMWIAVTLAAGAHKARLPAFGVAGFYVLFSLLLADAISVIVLGCRELDKTARQNAMCHGVLLSIAPFLALLVSSIAS